MDATEFVERWPSIAAIPCVHDLLADRDKYQALWHEQGLVSRRYRERAADAERRFSEAMDTLERVRAGNFGRVLELEGHIDTLVAIIREYRQQHDFCNSDPDDDLPHCPCDTCALALDALKSGLS